MAEHGSMSRTFQRYGRGMVRRAAMAAQNALELVRVGRLSSPYGAPFEVVHEDSIHKLRRYQSADTLKNNHGGVPLILVPPLMVASEIYDIAPDISAVTYLVEQGIDVWLVDFGAPEKEEGGMSRTLDDHIRAVSGAVDIVREIAKQDVHLAGYSQGGMFVYQTAALRGSEGLASLITFGSPVDIRRNVPAIGNELAERALDFGRILIARPLQQIDGLPGFLTSTGFKVLSLRKELRQFVDFVSKLHDRQALEKRESKRLFLGGQGFVSWPGPALRSFIDEMVVNNRMTRGGFVIDGKPLSLADISSPILYFVGERDDMARPASVRAIRETAINAEVFEMSLKAGHFGLVVGSKALSVSWPLVVKWLQWRSQDAPCPSELLPDPSDSTPLEDPDVDVDVQFDLELFYDVFANGLGTWWNRLGDVTRDFTSVLDNLRWQVPRLSKLRSIEPDTLISPGQVLAKQARSNPDQTFFLWKGRAFSYADADRRVNAVVRGLIKCGIRKDQRVGVLMKGRPSYLTVAAALSRLGAVAVLLNPDTPQRHLQRAFHLANVEVLVTDPENSRRGRKTFAASVLVLGGGGGKRSLPDNVIDMEAIDPDKVEVPAWHKPNPGRAADLAMVVLTAGRSGQPRAARITNRRWAFAAIGAAAACTLTPKDTVYCGVPLHHAAGTMVTTGAALVGGSRLAIGSPFAPETFWDEVRRYGATVVFYAGAMCRLLVNAPYVPGENSHPVRLFAGSGLRADAWERLVDRFGPVGVLEFYASTEGTAVLANASGEKMGAVGRPLPGSAELALVVYDVEAGDFAYDGDGRYVRCGTEQIGMLIARVGSTDPRGFERVRRDVFEDGDSWFFSGDLLRRDEDGDYWYVDRLVNIIRTDTGPVSTIQIEGVLYQAPEIALAVAYGVVQPGAAHSVPVATIKLREGATLDSQALFELVNDQLKPQARPTVIRVVDELAMTDGFRPLKTPLRNVGMQSDGDDALVLHHDAGYRIP